MIIFRYNNNYFCYLVNPKCGSHTFVYFYHTYLTKFVVKIHEASNSKKFDKNGKIDYFDYNYEHCNLEGAINFFKNKKIDLKNVVFFTTIRNPFDRILSNYWYTLKFHQKNKLFDNLTQQEDFNHFVLGKDSYHHQNFEPKNFRFNEQTNVYTLRLENWMEDFRLFCKKYYLPLIKTDLFEKVKFNTSDRKEKLYFNEEVINYITDKYHMDFIDGKYDLKPNN